MAYKKHSQTYMTMRFGSVEEMYLTYKKFSLTVSLKVFFAALNFKMRILSISKAMSDSPFTAFVLANTPSGWQHCRVQCGRQAFPSSVHTRQA